MADIAQTLAMWAAPASKKPRARATIKTAYNRFYFVCFDASFPNQLAADF